MREQGPSWAKKPFEEQNGWRKVGLMVPREVVVTSKSTFVLAAEIISILSEGALLPVNGQLGSYLLSHQ